MKKSSSLGLLVGRRETPRGTTQQHHTSCNIHEAADSWGRDMVCCIGCHDNNAWDPCWQDGHHLAMITLQYGALCLMRWHLTHSHNRIFQIKRRRWTWQKFLSLHYRIACFLLCVPSLNEVDPSSYTQSKSTVYPHIKAHLAMWHVPLFDSNSL